MYASLTYVEGCVLILQGHQPCRTSVTPCAVRGAVPWPDTSWPWCRMPSWPIPSSGWKERWMTAPTGGHPHGGIRCVWRKVTERNLDVCLLFGGWATTSVVRAWGMKVYPKMHLELIYIQNCHHWHRRVDTCGQCLTPVQQLSVCDLIHSFHESKFDIPNVTNDAGIWVWVNNQLR